MIGRRFLLHPDATGNADGGAGGAPPAEPQAGDPPEADNLNDFSVSLAELLAPPSGPPPAQDPPPAAEPPAAPAPEVGNELLSQIQQERAAMARERQAMQIDRALEKYRSQASPTEAKFIDTMVVTDKGPDEFLASVKRCQTYAQQVDSDIAAAKAQGREEALREAQDATGRPLTRIDIVKEKAPTDAEREILEKATDINDLRPILEDRTDGFMGFRKAR